MPDPAHLGAGPVTARFLSWRTAIEAAVAAVIAGALSMLVFWPARGAWDAPLGGGDLLATYVNTDTWAGLGFATTTHYGFPAGMDLNYTPSLDITENGVARLIGLVTGSPFAGINLVLLLSFPLVAALAYLAMRIASRGGPLAIALAVAVTMIPYHFGRGLGHTYLATMYGGVTAVILALAIGLGVLPSALADGTRRRRVAGWTLLVGAVVVAAWSGLYYAAFGIILTLAAVLWRIVRRDAWRRVGAYALVPVGLILLAVVGLLPGLLAVLQSPPATPLVSRPAYESVTLAGSLAMAITPAPISQLPGMWRYNGAVLEAVAPAPPLEGTALTNFGTWVTSAALLVFLVGWIVRARRTELAGTAVTFVAYLTAVVIAFFVPWGLNIILANVVTAQVRAWNRLLPLLLLLFAVGAMAVLVRTRWDRVGVRSIIGAVLVLVVVTVEQVLPFRPAYQQGADQGVAALTAARAYADALETAVPGRCGVLMLPFVPYPEQGPVEDLADYSHFLQPLVNRGKDFSYGAVRGTGADTLAAGIQGAPTRAQADALRDAGFCAIHVDRRGIPDTTWAFLQADLTSRFGPPVATGADGTWLAYRLG